MYEKLYENALFEPTRFHTAMNLYENGGLFVFNGLHGRFPIVSYSFIQTEYIYENMKLPIGHFIIHIHRKIIRRDTMVDAKKSQREHEPIKAGRSITQIDVEDYIATMVMCERLAAEKLQWSEADWAAHCLQQNAKSHGGTGRNG